MMGHIQVDGGLGIRLEECPKLVTRSLRCMNHGIKIIEVTRRRKVLDTETG